MATAASSSSSSSNSIAPLHFRSAYTAAAPPLCCHFTIDEIFPAPLLLRLLRATLLQIWCISVLEVWICFLIWFQIWSFGSGFRSQFGPMWLVLLMHYCDVVFVRENKETKRPQKTQKKPLRDADKGDVFEHGGDELVLPKGFEERVGKGV